MGANWITFVEVVRRILVRGEGLVGVEDVVRRQRKEFLKLSSLRMMILKYVSFLFFYLLLALFFLKFFHFLSLRVNVNPIVFFCTDLELPQPRLNFVQTLLKNQ